MYTTTRIRISCAGIVSNASSNEADGFVTLQLHQVCNVSAHALQFRPREMPPLPALGSDGNQHVELRGEAAQRGGV